MIKDSFKDLLRISKQILCRESERGQRARGVNLQRLLTGQRESGAKLDDTVMQLRDPLPNPTILIQGSHKISLPQHCATKLEFDATK